jgi:MFS family permease
VTTLPLSFVFLGFILSYGCLFLTGPSRSKLAGTRLRPAADDRSSTAAAIPRITTEFKSTQHLGWYGAAYVLGQMSTQPLFGRIYLYFEAKSTYLASLCVFMVGSVLSAAAPTSQSLIIGRVVCGCGTAGMLTGSLTIFGQVV